MSKFFAKRQLVTLFSAPNYCGEFDNAGGMMSVDETLMCSFQVPAQKPHSESRTQYANVVYLKLRCCSSDPETLREESQVPVRRHELGPARHSPPHSATSQEAMKGGPTKRKRAPASSGVGFSPHADPPTCLKQQKQNKRHNPGFLLSPTELPFVYPNVAPLPSM